MTEETYISISLEEYIELLKDSDFLGCLRAVGIDNWEGYNEAVTMYQEQNPDD